MTKAYPFRNLQLEDLIGVLDLLDSNYLIFFDRTKMTFWKKGRAFKYYFEKSFNNSRYSKIQSF